MNPPILMTPQARAVITVVKATYPMGARRVSIVMYDAIVHIIDKTILVECSKGRKNEQFASLEEFMSAYGFPRADV